MTMTDQDKPEANGEDQTESVEAEIVDEEASPSAENIHVESETTEKFTGFKADLSSLSKMTPGMVLVGAMLLLISLLSLGLFGGDKDEGVAPQLVAEPS